MVGIQTMLHNLRGTVSRDFYPSPPFFHLTNASGPLHILCCAKLLLDPKSKISCPNVASFLGRRASPNLKLLPWNQPKKKFKTFLKPEMGGRYSLIFYRAKNEEIFKKIFILTLYRSKTVLSFDHFCKIKNHTIKKISNFLYVDCSLMHKECFQIKLLIVRVPVIFLKCKFFWVWDPHEAEIADILELSS